MGRALGGRNGIESHAVTELFQTVPLPVIPHRHVQHLPQGKQLRSRQVNMGLDRPMPIVVIQDRIPGKRTDMIHVYGPDRTIAVTGEHA